MPMEKPTQFALATLGAAIVRTLIVVRECYSPQEAVKVISKI